MEHIFISHSRYDKEIKEFFARAIEKIEGFTFEMMELEDLADENVGVLIRDGIAKGCIGLVVLLGPNVKSPAKKSSRQHTHNWVSFEIGVAAGNYKPIAVFEDYGNNIDFPIPFLTDYIRYNRKNEEHLNKAGNALKTIFTNEMFLAPDGMTCRNRKCNAEYRYWGVRGILPCPVCRRRFDYGELITRNIPYRFDNI